jgi:hypothetical protein
MIIELKVAGAANNTDLEIDNTGNQDHQDNSENIDGSEAVE